MMLKRSKLKFVKIRQNLLKDIDYWFPIIDIIYALYGGNDNENNKNYARHLNLIRRDYGIITHLKSQTIHLENYIDQYKNNIKYINM